MDCAFICDQEDRFFNRLLAGLRKPCLLEPYHIYLSKSNISILPIAAANKSRQLDQSIHLAFEKKCSHIAMSPEKAALVSPAVKKEHASRISDGRLYAVATMPFLLDRSVDNWQKMNVAILVENAYMAMAARVAAKKTGNLQLVGKNLDKIQALAQLIYAESGLICPVSDRFLPTSQLLILPPQANSPHKPYAVKKEQQTWNQWANAAYLTQGPEMAASNTNKRHPSLPASLTQSILFWQLEQVKKDTLPDNWPDFLFLLAKKGEYYGLQPLHLY